MPAGKETEEISSPRDQGGAPGRWPASCGDFREADEQSLPEAPTERSALPLCGRRKLGESDGAAGWASVDDGGRSQRSGAAARGHEDGANYHTAERRTPRAQGQGTKEERTGEKRTREERARERTEEERASERKGEEEREETSRPEGTKKEMTSVCDDYTHVITVLVFFFTLSQLTTQNLRSFHTA